MKAIYAKDIKAMVKQFDLNEAESDYLNDIAEAINKERTDLCEDIQMTLLYGSYSKSKRNAIRALLVYFGAKAQKENELYRKLDRTCWEIAKVLKCGSYQVIKPLRVCLHRPNGRKRLHGVYKQPQRTRWGTMGVRVLQDIWQSLKESGCNRREKRIPKTD